MAYAGVGSPRALDLCLRDGWGDGIFRDELLLPGPSRVTTIVCSYAATLRFAEERDL